MHLTLKINQYNYLYSVEHQPFRYCSMADAALFRMGSARLAGCCSVATWKHRLNQVGFVNVLQYLAVCFQITFFVRMFSFSMQSFHVSMFCWRWIVARIAYPPQECTLFRRGGWVIYCYIGRSMFFTCPDWCVGVSWHQYMWYTRLQSGVLSVCCRVVRDRMDLRAGLPVSLDG